ncbi:very-long-chain-(S)-2-hydroxy-acid oxidase [Aureococcus anophagefferens]|nr:very-long-chain-(S)-2-hydroxy-acid oxidase [Aureococcus anophagefferens]
MLPFPSATTGENMGWSPHSLGVHKLLGPLRPLVTPVVDAASRRRLAKCVNVADLRIAAEKRMHRMCFGYLDSGADDEATLRRSKDAFLERSSTTASSPARGPRRSTPATLMGSDLALPFFSCPCAGNRMFHTEGEVAAAAVARERGSLYCLSTLATSTPDQRAADLGWGDGPGLDLGPAKQRPYTYANIDEDVPAEALAAFVNAQLACDFDWDDAKWLVGEWKRLRPGGTIALKGVRPDDAFALDLGFDCVWVSNHGAASSIQRPRRSTSSRRSGAVGCDFDLILDGGVQRARTSPRGPGRGRRRRPFLYGPARAARRASTNASMLDAELRTCMGLLGVRTVAELRSTAAPVRRRHPSFRDAQGARYAPGGLC